MLQKYRSILLTRPIEASRRMKNDLLSINNKLDILISPLIEIQYTAYDFIKRDYSAYIVTSENAINSLMSNKVSLGEIDVFCVGQQTQRLAIKAGYNVLGTYPRVELLVKDLSELKFKDKLFYFRGDHVSCDLKPTLGNKGIEIEEMIVYNQQACSLSKEAFNLLASKPCLIPLFSARTAKLFSKEVATLSSKVHLIYCMSENIKKKVALDWNCKVAPIGINAANMADICRL